MFYRLTVSDGITELHKEFTATDDKQASRKAKSILSAVYQINRALSTDRVWVTVYSESGECVFNHYSRT